MFPISKMFPTAVVLFIAGYGAWSTTEDPRPKAKGDEKRSEVAPSWLAPTTYAAAARDPFEPAAGPKAERKAAVEGNKSVVQPRPKPVDAGPDLVKLAGSFTLKAIFIQGDRRVALIDVKIVREGDILPMAKSPLPILVAEIYPERVVLRQGVKICDLKFPNRPVKSVPSRPKPKSRAKP